MQFTTAVRKLADSDFDPRGKLTNPVYNKGTSVVLFYVISNNKEINDYTKNLYETFATKCIGSSICNTLAINLSDNAAPNYNSRLLARISNFNYMIEYYPTLVIYKNGNACDIINLRTNPIGIEEIYLRTKAATC